MVEIAVVIVMLLGVLAVACYSEAGARAKHIPVICLCKGNGIGMAKCRLPPERRLFV